MIEDLFVPVVTPFDADGGVDTAALVAHCSWVVAEGARGVVLFGTTGEGPSVSAAEKLAAARAVAAELPTGCVIASATENSLTDTVGCVRGYAELGLAATLVLPPFYFRDATEDGFVAWYAAVLDAAELPVLAYSFPPMAPAVPVRVLAELDVWGAKESSGDLAWARAALGTGKQLMAGAEAAVVASLQLGAAGTIAGMGNVLPGALAGVCTAVRAGDLDRAERLLGHVLDVQRAIQAGAPGAEWIAAYKRVGGHLGGRDLGVPRLPLRSSREYLTDEVRAALDAG